MKKKGIVLLLILMTACLFLTGCDARLRIKEGNAAILRVAILDDEIDQETISEADIEGYFSNLFSASGAVDIDLKSYRHNRNGHHLRIKISPEQLMYDTYADGLAIGGAYRVFKEFSLDHFKRANWRTGKSEIEDALENQLLFAMDAKGNALDFYDVSRIMDNTNLRLNKAVYIKDGFYNMKVSLPGKSVITYSTSKDIVQLSNRSVVLGSGEVLLVYKSNFWGIVFAVLVLTAFGIIMYFVWKNKKANKVSDESPQRSVHTYFCETCGTPASKGDKFCRKCGAPVKMEE